MLAVIAAVILQQAAGQVVWEAPAPPVSAVAEAPALPTIPDWARSDPYGYERSECSPLVRRADESMEACQTRVRTALAANLGDALPVGLAAVDASEQCRPAAAGDGYGLQCAPRGLNVPRGPDMRVRECTTRPTANREGGMIFEETCTVGGEEAREGLRIRLGGDD